MLLFNIGFSFVLLEFFYDWSKLMFPTQEMVLLIKNPFIF